MSLVRLSIRTLLGAGIIALGGCTTLGPDFQTPPADIQPAWQSTGAGVDAAKPLSARWWTVFGDPVLNRLIDTAYRQNLSLQIAGLRIFEARAQLGVAIGQQYPQSQQLSASHSKVGLSENSANFLPQLDDRFTQADVAFDAAWELDFWGRFRRGVESADANLGASIADYDNALVSLTSEVARSYVALRTLEQRLAIARENTDTQTRSHRLAAVRFDNGAVSELDPAQALSLLKSTQSTVPQLESQIRQTRHALSVLLGMPPGDLNALLEPGDIPQAPDVLSVGVPAQLLGRRPDIRRAQLQAAAQSARIGVARSELFPRLALFGSIGLTSSDTFQSELNDLTDGDSVTYRYGPSVSWPILNYGRLKNRVRVEDARLEQLIANYQNKVLDAAREVEDAISDYIGARAQSRFLIEGVDAARRAVELALVQYREGAVDYQRVLDTQQNLLFLQDNHTRVRGNAVTALVAVYKALGGGWEVRSGEAFVPQPRQQQMRERTDWGGLLDDTLPQQLPSATGGKQPLLNAPQW